MTKKKKSADKDEKKQTKTAAAPPVYPITRGVSFVSRAPSSGKRRSYDVEGVAHGPDQFSMVINGQTIFLQRAGVAAVRDLLDDLAADTEPLPEDAPPEPAPEPAPEDAPDE